MNELKPKRILIVENDEGLLELLQELLNNQGYETFCYREVDDIFKAAEEHNPDLVFLDYLLPGINGGELCAQLKRDGGTAHIPVLICSAYPQVMLSLGSYGCNAFVAKPFEIDEILVQIKDCLNNPNKVFSGRAGRPVRM